MKENTFVKTHGLGNEYIVLDSDNISFQLTEKAIKRICNVNFGIGSDGILLKVPSDKADFGLRIYNPDGSEAEKSGNGLRIFCKYIYDYNFTENRQFTVETKGGLVNADIVEVTEAGKAKLITVDMGQAIFNAKEIPTRFDSEEAIGKKIMANGKEFEVNCVSMGNPHCVVLKEQLSIDEIKNGLSAYTATGMRLDIIREKDFTIINDCYTSKSYGNIDYEWKETRAIIFKLANTELMFEKQDCFFSMEIEIRKGHNLIDTVDDGKKILDDFEQSDKQTIEVQREIIELN